MSLPLSSLCVLCVCLMDLLASMLAEKPCSTTTATPPKPGSPCMPLSKSKATASLRKQRRSSNREFSKSNNNNRTKEKKKNPRISSTWSLSSFWLLVVVIAVIGVITSPFSVVHCYTTTTTHSTAIVMNNRHRAALLARIKVVHRRSGALLSSSSPLRIGGRADWCRHRRSFWQLQTTTMLFQQASPFDNNYNKNNPETTVFNKNGINVHSNHNTNNNGDAEESSPSSLTDLEAEIQRLVASSSLSVYNKNDDHNNALTTRQDAAAITINLHSPQQVSLAIFGQKGQSTSKAALQRVVDGHVAVDHASQRQLAALVLAYRRQWAQQRQQSKEENNDNSQSHDSHPSFMPPSPPRQPKQNNTTTPLSLQRTFSSLPQLEDDNEEQEEMRVDDEAEIHQRSSSSSSNLPEATIFASIQDDAFVVVDAEKEDSSSSLASKIIVDPYEQQIQTLFHQPSAAIDPYWQEPLLQLTRPSARSLVPQLNPECPLGYDPLAMPLDPLLRKSSSSADSPAATTTAGKKGSFLAFCREQKEKYPDCVILCRCGDFYETFGVDALLLIEHCGLNPMGSKAKAGCPIRNIQATLDGLTQVGLRVAVYEEAADTEATLGGSKSRLKSRFLAQIVSAASPTYLYDLLLLGNSAEITLTNAPAARPFCGVLSLAAGYTLVEVSWEERTVQVSERLTAEAVACRLAAYPPADPLFYVPSTSEAVDAAVSLPFLPSRRELATAGYGAKLRTRILPPDLVSAMGTSEVERAKRVIVQAVLSLTDDGVLHQDEDNGENHHGLRRRTTVDDFTLVSTQQSNGPTFTNPLYVETATQLGLLLDRTIPALMTYVLPEAAPASTKRFVRRLLLTPPPPPVADAMATLVTFAKERGPSLPYLNVPPIGKVLSLLRAGQASAQVYGELLQTLSSTAIVLETLSSTESDVIEGLMAVLEYESGLAGDPDSLRLRCLEAMKTIEAVISPIHHTNARPGCSINDTISNFGDCVPRAFLERNEMVWRGRVQPDAMKESYDHVAQAAHALAEAVAEDFWLNQVGQGKNLVVQDIFNNLIALKAIPDGVSNKSKYIRPRDRFGKVLSNRYTTERVQEALSNYVAASDRACQGVANALAALSQQLYNEGHMPAIVQASHSNLILSAVNHHASRANSLGWERADVRESDSDNKSVSFLHLHDVWPYWMDRKEAVGNSIDMDGIFLMTAPNMSGKSTLMRSTAAAALLSVCGLCAPLAKGSSLERFDHLFVRGASADVPSEQKSAFGAEMGDVAALLRCCGDKSLVFVDELGRGTSPRDGTRLAGAVLEAMATAGMKGVFATHLHGILDLPLQGRDRISTKRMAIHDRDEYGDESTAYRWTYRLEDGVCRDSMALVTAARFGLPQEVLSRAEALGEYLSSDCLVDGTSIEESSIHEAVLVSNTGNELNTLSDLATLAKQVTGQEALPIPPRWSAPSSYSGSSCVYIIELDEDSPRFYVGETDKLSQRIEQHRAKGRSWANASAVVLKALNKSEARVWESTLIRALAQAGVSLVSISDGRNKA